MDISTASRPVDQFADAPGAGQTHWIGVFGAVFGAGLIAGSMTLLAPLPAADGAAATPPPAVAQRPAC